MTAGHVREAQLMVVDSGLYIVSTWDWYEYLNFESLTGLATPNGPLVALHPGLNTGPVAMRTIYTDVRPTHVDPGPPGSGWVDIVEVSAYFPEAPVSVVTTDQASLDDITDGRHGDFRLRIHALGRAEDYDEAPQEVTEHYLIHLWPATKAPPQVLLGRNSPRGQAS